MSSYLRIFVVDFKSIFAFIQIQTDLSKLSNFHIILSIPLVGENVNIHQSRPRPGQWGSSALAGRWMRRGGGWAGGWGGDSRSIRRCWPRNCAPAPSPSTLHPKGAQHTLAITLSLNQLNTANIKIMLGNFLRGGMLLDYLAKLLS